MFIHRTDGKSIDATGAIVDFIRVASSSGFGSTHLIGHELGHNLMSIARDAGVITEAQQKELDALFTDKNGKFDEEAFAEAFARELKRAFFETVQKRMEDVPATKAGRALRRVADFIATLARSFAFWRQERGLDPVTGQPLQAGQVLDAFLKRERTAVDEATRIANAARAAEARATQEAMANAPTQTVVDEDGTVVAYHERGDRDVTAQDFERTFGMYAPYSFADVTYDDMEGAPPELVEFTKTAQRVAQEKANGAYDGLMAIAKLMGVPPETLSLGGLISPSFGRLYPQGFNGIYFSNIGELVIPTKRPEDPKDVGKYTKRMNIWSRYNSQFNLAESTAIHEWMHALDHALASGRDADWRNDDGTAETPSEKYKKEVRFRHPKSDNLVGANLEDRKMSFPNGRGPGTDGVADSVRPEVCDAFAKMMEAVKNTAYGKRQTNALEWLKDYPDEEFYLGSAKKTADYYSAPDEMLARAFEQTIVEASGKPSKREYNQESFDEPNMVDVLSFPTSEEVQELLPIFREFFSALKVGVNETTGVQTLYHDPEGRTRYEWENWTREEKLERIRATNDIHIVTPIEGDEAELLAKYLEKAEGHKKDIVDWALNEQNRIVSAINTNAFIGNIKTSGNSIRSILSHGSGPLKVLVLRHLDEILTNAVPYRIGKGKKEGRTFINLAHRLSFDGREHIAYVSILEDRNGNRTYDVEFGSEERLLRELPNGPAARNESEADADSRNTNSIAQSGEDVKSDPNEERMNHISDGSGVSPENERYLDAIFGNDSENVDIRWHESEGAVLPRFTETPLGQELVAEAFDAIMGSRVDLLLRPSRYYGNPYETRDRNPRNALVTEHLHRDVDVSEPRGFATEVSAEISRFGTREGDPTLRDIRARCGSKERFYEVLGAVYETAEAIRSGLSEVVTGRERTMMSNAGLLAAEFIKHNATARATALGRKLYLMGREFAWKLYKEDIAAARAEAQAKVQEANAKTREAKAQTRNAERREETARNQAYQNRWGLAEERFMREYERALLRHQAARKVSDVREKMQEQVDLLRLREAKKRALERERGVTFTALRATLGVDIPARLRALAGTQEDPFEAAAKLIAEIDDGFDKWVKRDRRDLLDGTKPYTYLNEQGERAYAETMGNVLKAVARDLSYGKLREALVNAADKIARSKPETVRVIVEGKLGRVARVLRLAQNADIVTLARRRIKSALAEANKRLSSANSGMRTRYMTAMRKQAKELIKTMQLAVSAQDNTKASEKKKQAMLAERARLADELNLIESGKTPDDLAKDETLTDRQHQDAVKLMFLEKFGDLSFTIDPAEVWAKAAEAEAFVVS